MNASDRPPERPGHDVTFRYGVWVARNGSRIEVIRVGERWRVDTYLYPAGGRPSQVLEYDDQASMVRAIAEIEAQGYRYDPDRRPDSPRGGGRRAAAPVARRSDMRTVLAVALLCIVLIAIEYVLTR